MDCSASSVSFTSVPNDVKRVIYTVGIDINMHEKRDCGVPETERTLDLEPTVSVLLRLCGP